MAKPIMIQGTMSNAGKSIIAAGLCRIFVQDGYRVAPFKSQNMALNSYITENGLEMGRAQVIQAEAAKVKPDIMMNPILLKPTNDTGSQVIVNGEVVGNMKAADYFKYKKTLIPEIMRAYEKLSKDNDIIVIEGAGSPAEINLKSEDIVNMGLAKMVKAPVLLVGDIDRGGVFAQLVGTMMLLDNDEQEMVKGLIINKFRGDKQILEPGLRMLEEKALKNVCGVVPFMHIDIEDEDSLSERFDMRNEAALIDIAVIKLPRISNFTDFNSLERINGVGVRFVSKASGLGSPDMIIIPGTKNTMGDLLWLRQCGLEAAILKEASKGKTVFGICGGFQMLGEKIMDPYAVEAGGEINGMRLLPIETAFEEKKTRTRVEGFVEAIDGTLKGISNAKLEGYEIHMGTTKINSDLVKPFSKLRMVNTDVHEKFNKFKYDGAVLNNIYGTYAHGVFDSEELVKGMIECLGKKKGITLNEINTVDYKQYKEKQYDLLADCLREALDMEAIYRILEAGV